MAGKYIAVGAGPAADLITLRGLRALERAEVILYDKLIDPLIIEDLNAEKIFVGKTPYGKHTNQEEINSIIASKLAEGKTVARLKGGDSLLFSRVAEELCIARENGAEIEIIPGVTAASGAMARAQIPLTDRLSSQGAVFITGHAKKGDEQLPGYNWKLLASVKLTLVVYMGVKHITLIAKELIKHGLDNNTPVLVASKIEQPEEFMQTCTVKALADGNFHAENPALFIIGKVLEIK